MCPRLSGGVSLQKLICVCCVDTLVQVKDSIERANARLREEVDAVSDLQKHALHLFPTAL
jgi:hypothetical protein